MNANTTREPTGITKQGSDAGVTWPQRLCGDNRRTVLLHLLRLSEQDRRMRFSQKLSDAGIAAYVNEISFEERCCFGLFDERTNLVSLAEGIPFTATGGVRRLEAAFSTDSQWRNVGLARAGFEALKEWGRSAGIEEIVLQCDARNAAMRGLLRSVGAITCVDRLEVDARLVLESWRQIDGRLP